MERRGFLKWWMGLVGAALLRGEGVPDEAANLMGKPFIPEWMYRWIGNWGFRKEAKKRGSRDRLYERPYEDG